MFSESCYIIAIRNYKKDDSAEDRSAAISTYLNRDKNKTILNYLYDGILQHLIYVPKELQEDMKNAFQDLCRPVSQFPGEQPKGSLLLVIDNKLPKKAKDAQTENSNAPKQLGIEDYHDNLAAIEAYRAAKKPEWDANWAVATANLLEKVKHLPIINP